MSGEIPEWALAVDPWEAAKELDVVRHDYRPEGEILDKGVNFFVLTLEHIGAKPKYSCEGHPRGFYIAFAASYSLAVRVANVGFFSIEISRKTRFGFGRGWWRLSAPSRRWLGVGAKECTLRLAAQQWANSFWPSTPQLELERRSLALRLCGAVGKPRRREIGGAA